MWAEVKELWKFRSLLFSMVQRDLSVRYKNSFLGFIWSMINPLLTVLVLTFVFKYIAQNDVPNYSAYILAAYLPYMFFQMAIMDSAQSVLGNIHLMKKIYFPREIFPIAIVISNFIHFLLALLIFFVYLLAIYIFNTPRVPIFQWTTIYLPVLILISFLLATGLGLFFSAINTFYEDVKYILGVVLSLLFFLAPIMYFGETVYYGRPKLYTLYFLNPISILSDSYRKILLAPQPVQLKDGWHPARPIDWTMLGIAAAFSVVIFFVGYAVFNRLKWKFVERP